MSVDNRTITKASFNNNPVSPQGCQDLQQDTTTVERVKAFATKYFGIQVDQRVTIHVTVQTVTVQILDSRSGTPRGTAKILEKQADRWISPDNSTPLPSDDNQDEISLVVALILTKVEQAWLKSQPTVSSSGNTDSLTERSKRASVSLGPLNPSRTAAPSQNGLYQSFGDTVHPDETLQRQLNELEQRALAAERRCREYEAERAAVYAYAENL
jgi:hypothetical protein